MMKKKWVLIALLSVGFITKAQDAAFTQYYASMLYLNPAFAGEVRDLEFSGNYRTQWRTVSMPYNSSQMSFIVPLYRGGVKKIHYGGVGLSLYTDKAGDGELKTTGANLSLSKLVRLSQNDQHVLAFGLQAGLVQRRIDLGRLEWGEQYQPFLGYSSTIVPLELTGDLRSKIMFADISAGAVYYFNDVQEYTNGEFSGHFGISGYHLNKPNESFSNLSDAKLPRIFKLHGGIDIPLSPFIYFSPEVLTMLQGEKYHINGGARIVYNLNNKSPNIFLEKMRLIIGMGARINDALIFSAAVGNRVFTLGYSYDMNRSGLNEYSRGVGVSELSLILKNPIDHLFKSVDTPRI